MIRVFFIFLLATLLTAAEQFPLVLAPFNGPNPSFREPEAGTFEVRGPMSLLATPAQSPSPVPLVLEFEYFCVGGVPAFAVLPGPPYQARTHRRLPAIGHSEAWSPYAAPLDPPGKPLPAGWKSLRLDLPIPAGTVLQLRKLQLRPTKPGEFGEKKAAAATDENTILAYLDGKPRSRIDDVRVADGEVTISGTIEPGRDLLLAEVPLEHLLDDPKRAETTHEITTAADGRFSITLPRVRDRSGQPHDRLLSRWQLVTSEGSGISAASHSRYADHVTTRSPHPPAAKLATKKGLGGWSESRMPGGAEELDALGISAVTVNIMIHSLVSLTPGPKTTPIHWQGRTYHAREDVLSRFDRTLLEAAKRKAVVSAILLVANPARGGNDPVVARIGHPDAVREGTFAMPNVTDTEGVALYGAILNLMAERWSRSDGKHGRVHHWIMHNEVDAGWVWTNSGHKPAAVYMDLLHRSLRMMDLIARQYDPNARPFLSLTHHWAEAGPKNWYGSKTTIDLLARFSRAEGDFAWAVAHHPYPQDLRNPRTWEDHQATFDFDTQKITPHNIEVLDAYMRQPHLLHRGSVRPVHLSENGFNSRDYSNKELTDQAAGMAYAWNKIRNLESIEVWHYHNWIDNRSEGGLRIGLRKFPDEPGDPFGKKPVWHLYQALGTPREDQVSKPYLETIGIHSWEEVRNPRPLVR